jgi:hypothetical protein
MTLRCVTVRLIHHSRVKYLEHGYSYCGLINQPATVRPCPPLRAGQAKVGAAPMQNSPLPYIQSTVMLIVPLSLPPARDTVTRCNSG